MKLHDKYVKIVQSAQRLINGSQNLKHIQGAC